MFQIEWRHGRGRDGECFAGNLAVTKRFEDFALRERTHYFPVDTEIKECEVRCHTGGVAGHGKQGQMPGRFLSELGVVRWAPWSCFSTVPLSSERSSGKGTPEARGVGFTRAAVGGLD